MKKPTQNPPLSLEQQAAFLKAKEKPLGQLQEVSDLAPIAWQTNLADHPGQHLPASGGTDIPGAATNGGAAPAASAGGNIGTLGNQGFTAPGVASHRSDANIGTHGNAGQTDVSDALGLHAAAAEVVPRAQPGFNRGPAGAHAEQAPSSHPSVIESPLASSVGAKQPTFGGGTGSAGLAQDQLLAVSGQVKGVVTEDGQLMASGTLVADGGAPGAKTWALGTDTGHYGTLELLQDGQWHYKLDNANPQVQALQNGATVTEHFAAFVTDAKGQTQLSQIVVTVRGTNDAAVITGVDTGQVSEDQLATTAGKLDVTDVDTGEATFSPIPQAQAAHGTFTIAADGSWTYQLDNSQAAVQSLKTGETLTDTITVSSRDGTLHQISVNIHGTDDTAVISGTAVGTVTEDTQPRFAGKLDVADPDAGQAEFVAQDHAAGQHGEFALAVDGSWTYTLSSTDATVQTLRPGDPPLTDTLTVASKDGSTQTLTVFIQGSNDAPILQAGTQHAQEDGAPVQGRVVGTDIDSTDTLFYHAPQGVPGFTLFADGSYSFDPSDPAYQHIAAGEQQFVNIPVTVTDLSGASDTQTLQLIISGTNDAPLLMVVPPMAVFEGSPTIHSRLAALDVDDHDTLTYRATAPVAGFTLQADGHYSFDPSDAAYDHLAFGQKQIISVPVEVVDSSGATASRTIQLTLTGTNDAPILGVTPARNVAEGAVSVTGQLTASDPDTGDTLTYSLGHHVEGFTLNADGSYSFDPADPHYNYLPAGQKAIVSIPVIVTDQHGGSDTGHMQITVTGTNDAPIVGGIDHAMGAVARAHAGRLHINGQLSVIDLDQGEGHFQGQILHGTYGVLEIKPDGHWDYTADAAQPALVNLAANGHLPEQFTVRTADGTTHTIDLQIKGANAPAIFAGVTAGLVTEDQAGTISHHVSVTDLNAGESTFQPQDIVTTYGHFTLNAGGDWTYALDNANPAVQALTPGQSLSDSIIVGSVDGTPKVISVAIQGQNDRAVISGTHTGDVIEDNLGTGPALTASGQLTITDPDAGQEHFTAMQGIAGDHGYGVFNIDADGHWTYSADNSHAAIQALKDGEQVTDTFTALSADGTPQTITVTLTGTNDVAMISGVDAGTLREDVVPTMASGQSSPFLTLSGNLAVTDVDQGEAMFPVQYGVSDNGFGKFILTPAGHWSYTADNAQSAVQSLGVGHHLTDSFTVHSADGTSHTITVTIEGSNDAPVLAAVTQSTGGDLGSTNEDQPRTFTQAELITALGATDVDTSDHLTVTSVRLLDPSFGTIQHEGDGSWTFTPAANFNRDHFRLEATVSDGTTTTKGFLGLRVNPVADAAVVGGVSTGSVTEDQHVSSSGKLEAAGTLAVTDPDAGQAVFVAQTDVHGSLGLGSFSIGTHGHWTYSADNGQAAIQQLKATDAQLTDSLTVTTADGTQHTITVRISGTADAAVITGVSTGDVTEDQGLTTGGPVQSQGFMHTMGTLSVSDADAGEAAFTAQSALGDQGLGHFQVMANGVWMYVSDPKQAAIQALGAGQTLTDSHTVTSVDGTTHTVTVTIHGSNDAPVLSAITGQTAAEDGAPLTGQFHATDADHGDTLSYSTGSTVDGFTLHADGSYSFDPAHTAYQHLGAGQTQTITIPVIATDGQGAHSATQELVITLTGTDDAPVIGLAGAGAGAAASGPALELTTGNAFEQLLVGLRSSDVIGLSDLSPSGAHDYNGMAEIALWLMKSGAVVDQFLDDMFVGMDPVGQQTARNQLLHAEYGMVLKGPAGTPDQVFAGYHGVPGHTQYHDLPHTLSLGELVDWHNRGPGYSVQFLRPVGGGDVGYFVDSPDAAGRATGEVTIVNGAFASNMMHHGLVIPASALHFAPFATGPAPELTTGQSQEDTVTTLTGTLHAHDIDDGDALSFAVKGNAHGSYGDFHVDAASGTWTYTLHAGAQGLKTGDSQQEHFTIVVTDAHGQSAEQVMTMTVKGEDDRSVIAGTLSGAVSEDRVLSASGQLTISDADTADHPGFVTHDASNPLHGSYGSLTLDAQGNWHYTLDNTRGSVQQLNAGTAAVTDLISVQGSDGSVQQIRISIAGSNDAPTISDVALLKETAVDTARTYPVSYLLRYAQDVDDIQDTLHVQHLQCDPAQGTVALSADGKEFTFTPATGFTGMATLRYDVVDPQGGSVATHADLGVGAVPAYNAMGTGATVKGDVDLGTASSGGATTLTLQQLTATTHDIDHDPLHVFNIAPDHGTLSGPDLAGNYLYTPQPGYVGPVTFHYEVTDSSQATGIREQAAVAHLNLVAPVLGGDVTGAAIEDSRVTITGDLSSTTPGTALHLGDHAMAGHYGALDLRDGGHWVYTLRNGDAAVQGLKDGEVRTETFTVNVPGGQTQDIVITVTGTHDQPVISVPTAAQQTIGGVTVVHDITAATDLSGFTAQQAGVTVGLHIVGLYMPGSAVNELAGIDPAQLPATHVAYANHADNGYQFLTGNAWFEQHLSGGAARFAPLAPDVRNTWDGGLVVFSDGSVGHLIKVCDDPRPGEHDYIYFKLIPGINARQGLTTLTGSGTAGSQVEIFEGSTSLGHVTVGADGHWAFSTPNALADGDHLMHTESGGVQSALIHAQVSGSGVTITVETPGLGSVTEDAAQDTLSGQLSITDADIGDNPAFTAQANSAGHYGSFSIDAQGHWHYTLNNSLAATQALSDGDHQTETFHVEVTTASGEHVSRDVTVSVLGTNAAPTVTAPDTAHAADLGTLAEDTVHHYSEADLLRIVGATDADHDTLHLKSIAIDPANGVFSRESDGSWTFTPAANYKGAHLPVTLVVTDGHVDTTAHAQVGITPVADAPSLSLSLGAVALTTHTEAPQAQVLDQVAVTNPFSDTTTIDMVFSRHVAFSFGSGVDPHLITGVTVNGQDITGTTRIVNTAHGSGIVFDGLTNDLLRGAGEITLHFAQGAPHADTIFVSPGFNDSDFAFAGGSMAQGMPMSREVSGGQPVTYQAANFGEDEVIPLHLTVGSPDASEAISVTLTGLPAGAQLSAGTTNPDGSWNLDPADLPGLTLTPPADFAGEIRLSVTAISTDGTDSASTHTDLRITLDPVAETPTLSTTDVTASEDSGALALDIALSVHVDPTETASITIEGLAPGATLSAGTPNPDGSWTLDPADLPGLQLTPDAQWSGTMALTITATSTEQTGESATSSTSLSVHVNPLLDLTMGVHDVSVQAGSAGGVALPVDFTHRGEDASESIDDFILHVPDDTWTIGGLTGTPPPLVRSGSDSHYLVTAAELEHLHLIPPPGFHGDAHIELTGSLTDNGVSTPVDLTFTLSVTNDAPTVSAGFADFGATPEDTSRTFTNTELLQLTGASDANQDALQITAVTVDAQYGTFAHQPNGDWLFTPVANAHHNDIPLSISVSDGHATTQAQAVLDVTSVTDAAHATMLVVAEQHVIQFGDSGAPAIYTTGGIQSGGNLDSFAIEMTVVGGSQVAVQGINGPTLISYATSGNMDEMYLWRPENLQLHIGGQNFDTGVDISHDSGSHRYGFVWNSAAGTFDVLRDGQIVKHLDHVAVGAQLTGGGVMAFGNDQDSLGGGFQDADAWHGKLFSATMAKGVTAAQMTQGPLHSLAHGADLILDVQAQGAQVVDLTGHHTMATAGPVTMPTVMVDTSLANPNPGALLHITPTITTPDPDDHVVGIGLYGFAAGTVVSDGQGHSHTFGSPTESYPVTGWTLSTLTAQLPAGSHDNMQIGMSVTTTGPDGQSQTTRTTETVIVDPTHPVQDALVGGQDHATTDEDTAVSGQLTITDSTVAETHFDAREYDGHFGHFSMAQNGHWTYTPDDRADTLTAGHQGLETFTVFTGDGSRHDVHVTLTGTDDGVVASPAPAPDPQPVVADATGTTINAEVIDFTGTLDSHVANAQGGDTTVVEYPALVLDPSQPVPAAPSAQHDAPDITPIDHATIDLTGSLVPAPVPDPVDASLVAHDGSVTTTDVHTTTEPVTHVAPTDTLHDYMQFAGEHTTVGASESAPDHAASPLDDYFAAAGVTPEAIHSDAPDLPPTELLLDTMHDATAAATPDHQAVIDAAALAFDTAHLPDITLQEDPQHHGI